MNGRPICAYAVLAATLFILTGTLHAATPALNQSILNSSLQYVQCKTTFTNAFISDLHSVSPKLSSLGSYSTAITAKSSTLGSIAASGNITSFRTYVSGTYDAELNTIAKNVSASINAANLSANATAQIRADYNSTMASYRKCESNSLKQYALNKVNVYNNDISQYQNQISDYASKGINTTDLSQLLTNAQNQIITPLTNAIDQATNNTQINAALGRYCLFNSCKNGTNFHLAAHFSTQGLESALSYLETDKNISSSSLATAQSGISNATSILTQVGTKIYVNLQQDLIFDNLSTASKAMNKARQQENLPKLMQQAQKVVANYQRGISKAQATASRLGSKGIDTSQMNSTISQAERTIIAPLQSAINSSANYTQLYDVLKANCLDNGCKNGTNFHFSAQLQLEGSQAYLAYIGAKANASSGVKVNQTALADAQLYLTNASSLLSSIGAAQISQSQEQQLDTYYSQFTSALRHAYTITPTSKVANAISTRGSSASIVHRNATSINASEAIKVNTRKNGTQPGATTSPTTTTKTTTVRPTATASASSNTAIGANSASASAGASATVNT
ncbi:MAG: hypothetical protein KGH61_04720 [Candidatus Micrarchaeota archaeon]|nr:hypothetical protein [Candidatus Micrarchaeota archaeon]MDE1848220.1 hypothetical protein [Candidatus Micrarchaeota archaeon]MDE1864894.1 hypothetical protein [Candidatus Micrarchaeota archaeon]